MFGVLLVILLWLNTNFLDDKITKLRKGIQNSTYNMHIIQSYLQNTYALQYASNKITFKIFQDKNVYVGNDTYTVHYLWESLLLHKFSLAFNAPVPDTQKKEVKFKRCRNQMVGSCGRLHPVTDVRTKEAL